MAAVKETVTIVRKPKVDKLKPASGPTAEIDIDKVIVIPRAAFETDKGWVQRSGYTLYIPAGKPTVYPEDTIRVRGELYSVLGVPGDYRRKRGPSVIVTVERVGGTSV